MLKKVVSVMFAVAFSAAAVGAQTTPGAAAQKPGETKQKPAAAAVKAAAEPPAQPFNIRIEVSITDQTGTNQPAKKVVSMIASDRQNTNIRSSASVPVKMPGSPASYNYRTVTINVDARPSILVKESGSKVLVNLGLEYMPKAVGNQEEIEPGMASLSQRLALILESGKPMVVSQAADPVSDRKITVEVTATILK